MSNIGVVYERMGRFQEALEMYQKALEIRIKVFNGRDHTDVADSKYNIANVFETQGKRDEARKLFLECEQIYSKEYGPDHEETLEAARRAGALGQDSGHSGWMLLSACCSPVTDYSLMEAFGERT